MAIGTMAAKLGGRLALLIPMAACAMLLLESQDRTVRVLAFVAIIVLEQIRQFLLLVDVEKRPVQCGCPACLEKKKR